MNRFLSDAWEHICDALVTVTTIPVLVIALIGAGLLHGAMFALEKIDPIKLRTKPQDNNGAPLP